MMQNSLDRLLDGAIRTLLDTVLPAVDDDYVRGQVRATAEVLSNLGTRVEWSTAQLLADIEQVRTALGAVLGALPAGELADARAVLAAPLPTGNAGLVHSRTDHLAALARAQHRLRTESGPDADRARAVVAAVARDRLDGERARLRSGMYS